MLLTVLVIFIIFLFYIGVAFILNLLEYSKIRLAEKHYKAGRVEEALKIFKEELEKHPDNLDCIMSLAKINQELGIHEKAIHYLEMASEIGDKRNDVDQIIIHARLAKLYIKTHQIEKAFLSLLTLKHNDVDSWEVYFYLGNIYAGQEMYEDAIECYTKASTINSDDFFSSYYASLCAVKIGAHNRACDFINGPFEDKFTHEIPEAGLYSGYLFRFKDIQRSIDVLEEFMAESVNELMKSKAALILGINYLLTQNYVMARDAFKRGLGFFPRDSELFDKLVINYGWSFAIEGQPIDEVKTYKDFNDLIISNLSSEEYREILNFLRQPDDSKRTEKTLLMKIEKLWHNAVKNIKCPVDIHDYVSSVDKANLEMLKKEFDKEIESEKNLTKKSSGLWLKFLEILKAPEHYIKLLFSDKMTKRPDMAVELYELLADITSNSIEKSRASMNRLFEMSSSDSAVVLIDGIFGAPKEIKDEIVNFFTNSMNTNIFEGVLKYLKLYNKDNFTLKDHLDPVTKKYLTYFINFWENMDFRDFRLLCNIFSRLFEEEDHHYITEFKKLVPAIINERVLKDKSLRNKGDLFLEMISKIRPCSMVGSLLKAPGAASDYWTVKISRSIAEFDKENIKKEFEKIYFSKNREHLKTAKNIFSLAYGSETVFKLLSGLRINYNIIFITPHGFLGKTGTFYIEQAGFNVSLYNQASKASAELNDSRVRLVIYDTETTDMTLNSFLQFLNEKKREHKIFVIAVVQAGEESKFKDLQIKEKVSALISKPVDFDTLMAKTIKIFE